MYTLPGISLSKSAVNLQMLTVYVVKSSMNFSKTFLWIALVVTAAVMMAYSKGFQDKGLPTILSLETADREEGASIIARWSENGLIGNAQVICSLDFLFLVLYVLLMIRSSVDRMNMERNRLVRALLRLNITLAIITGLLDVVENILLLINLRQSGIYVRSFWITWPKFFLAAWIVLVWLTSIIKGWGQRLFSRTAT